MNIEKVVDTPLDVPEVWHIEANRVYIITSRFFRLQLSFQV